MTMTAGLPTGSKRPVNCRPPVAPLMRNEVIASPFLVAGIKILAAGIDGEAAGGIPVHPDVRNHPQLTVARDVESCDAAVQTIRHIQVTAVGADDDFRRQIAAGELGRQCRHELPGFEAAFRCVVIVNGDLRIVLVQIVEHAAVRMKREMPRRGARRGGNHRHVGGQQAPGLRIEAPNQCQVESRIVRDDELAARIRCHHVQMRGRHGRSRQSGRADHPPRVQDAAGPRSV